MGAAREMENGSARKAQPFLHRKSGGEAGAERRSDHQPKLKRPDKKPPACAGPLHELLKAPKGVTVLPQTEAAASPQHKPDGFLVQKGDGANTARTVLTPASPSTGDLSLTALHRQAEKEIWAALTAALGPDYWSFTCKHKT